jgi:hypothetical protein
VRERERRERLPFQEHQRQDLCVAGNIRGCPQQQEQGFPLQGGEKERLKSPEVKQEPNNGKQWGRVKAKLTWSHPGR